MKFTYFALAISSALAITGCGGGSGGNDDNIPPEPISHPDPTIDANAVVFSDISVHDPSVIRADDGAWYVVGSHLAMAKSNDLMSWEYVAKPFDPVTPEEGEDTILNNPLFNTYVSEAAEGIEWVNGNLGSWASDIIKVADDRYYFYYNHCATGTDPCNAPRSYMGVAVSESIEGPFEDLGVFLYSGQSADEVEAGFGIGEITAHDANIHPNVIDPDAFYDKDGKLWMTYGSYSGGIFILEMDEATGKPLANQGYGKHLAGGNHSPIEGSYMLYSPESDYYYLFTSFGGFGSTQGYNIRVSRSRNPDGPFVDAKGQDMANAKGNAEAIAEFGVKLMGGFEFTAKIGDNVESRGYLSPGHNSAYYDAQTGQYFLIAHTRFTNPPASPEFHSVRVHEMFINDDGWLTVSPQRYAPIIGENIVDAGDLAGRYKVINHGREMNTTAIQSQNLILNSDRTISGDYSGFYRLDDSNANKIDLHLDGRGKWVGELRWQWDEMAGTLAPIFTALSADGAAMWGTQMEKISDVAAIGRVTDAISIPEIFTGTVIDLPLAGTRGTQITWSSSNESVISTDGRVSQPTASEGDQNVTLTATMTLGKETITQDFTVTIPARAPFNQPSAFFSFEGDLSEALGNHANAVPTGDRIWKTGESEEIAFADASDRDEGSNALALDGTNGVLLPYDIINNYEYTVSFWAKPTIIRNLSTAFFGAINPVAIEGGTFDSYNWLSFLPQWEKSNVKLWSFSESRGWFDGPTGKAIPAGQWSHLAFSINKGKAQVFINGVEAFNGGNIPDLFSNNEGYFALGVNYLDTPFEGLIDDLKIYPRALVAEELGAIEYGRTLPSEFTSVAASLIDLGDISQIKTNIELPTHAAFDTRVTWSSSKPEIIAIDSGTGAVTRPGRDQEDAQVRLTASVTRGGQIVTRDFDVTVAKAEAPTAIARYSFEDNLSDSTDNFSDGVTTGDRINISGGSSVFSAGVAGKALQLDGTYGVKLANDYITGSIYSISLWINPTSLQILSPALFADSMGSGWMSVVPGGIANVDGAMLWADAGGFKDLPTGVTLEIGTWNHFAAVYNNSEMRVFLNGEERFVFENFPDIFSGVSGSEFGIGVNPWDAPFNGLIDELVFFDEPLTTADVAIIYAEGTAQ